MNRIDQIFAQRRAENRTVLIPFITAGDPDLKTTAKIMSSLVEAGADIIELGVPFSDPMADGPVIQRSSERALQQGVNLEQIIDLVADFRRHNEYTPIVLMGYANPIEAMGAHRFVELAQASRVDGVLVVDYPPEEATDFSELAERYNLALIFLLSPTTTEERIPGIAKLARGYVYYVSLKGVTGAAHLNSQDVADKLAVIRRYVKLPIGVGFGIRDSSSAKAIARHADAVIIGSRLIEEIERTTPNQAALRAAQWLKGIRQALDEKL